MQKLKILLLYKKSVLIIAFFILYILYGAFFKDNKSKYNYEKEIYGKITDYKIKDDKITMIIKGKENIIATYYFKSKNEVENIGYGDYIIAKGNMNIPTNNTIPNTFNYKIYLSNKKIYKTFYIDVFQTKKSKNPFYILKNDLYKRVDNLKSAKYIKALILGNKNYMDEEEIESVKNNGIMHLFAISGMHVSLIISLLNLALKSFKKIYRSMIITLVIFIYIFIVGFMPSIIRVGVFFLLSSILELLKIKISNINKLLLCALVMLLLNPLFIFDLGFIYSFILVFYLYYYNPKSYVKTCILTFITSIPITIYNFYEINILSIIINVLFIPVVSYFLFPLSFITLIIPSLDKILYFVFNLFMKVNIIISKISILKLIIGKPPLILIILLYIAIILYKNNKKYIYLIISLAFIIIIKKINFDYKIIYLDVKQGDSSLIITPHNKDAILIDTGGIISSFSNKTYNISNSIISYLKSIGLNSIDYLIITHGDYDHMGEAINLVNNFKVEKVIFNCGEYNDLEKELIKVLDKKKIPYYSCIKELNIDKNKLYFLQTKEYNNENDNSNVFYTELNGYKFMFMGDASSTTEKEILDKYNLPDIDVLKVGHHGSKTSSSKKFIDEINPKYSIISVGKNNRYGHPNKEVLENLKETKIYRTDIDGSIMFKIKNNKLKIETCAP